MEFYNLWMMPRTMMVCETDKLPNPIGFVHFGNPRDPRFLVIEKTVNDYDKGKR